MAIAVSIQPILMIPKEHIPQVTLWPPLPHTGLLPGATAAILSVADALDVSGGPAAHQNP